MAKMAAGAYWFIEGNLDRARFSHVGRGQRRNVYLASRKKRRRPVLGKVML